MSNAHRTIFLQCTDSGRYVEYIRKDIHDKEVKDARWPGMATLAELEWEAGNNGLVVVGVTLGKTGRVERVYTAKRQARLE